MITKGNGTVFTCPICGAFESHEVAHPDYRQCGACCSVYQTRKTQAVDDYYANINESPDFRGQRGSYAHYLRRLGAQLTDAENFSLIDIGGGDGLFAEMAKAAFGLRNIAVVEASETSRSVLRARNIPVVTTKDIKSKDRKIVSALQVIEHAPDPLEFIRSFHLQPDDYVLLTSPSVDTPYFRYYGKYWRSYSPSHHLVLYSRKGLEYLFERNDIELLHYEHCVSGVHNQFDELLRFCARVALWPVRRMKNPKYQRIQLFHGRASFLAIGKQH